MKKTTLKTVSFVLATSMLLASCSSTTTIQSSPSGAKVYLDGEPVGVTPYIHRDSKIVGSTTTVKLEKEGYEEMKTAFSRNEEADVGAIIGGLFVLVPFLWTMKYKPMHYYELVPSDGSSTVKKSVTVTNSKADQLRELKQLLDEQLINAEEYEAQKTKILNAD